MSEITPMSLVYLLLLGVLIGIGWHFTSRKMPRKEVSTKTVQRQTYGSIRGVKIIGYSEWGIFVNHSARSSNNINLIYSVIYEVKMADSTSWYLAMNGIGKITEKPTRTKMLGVYWTP